MFRERRDIQAQIIKILWDFWAKHPDLRLGQIISNAAGSAKIDAYYIDDDVLATMILDYKERVGLREK